MKSGIFILVILSLFSCGTGPSSSAGTNKPATPVTEIRFTADMDNPAGDRELKLSDILDSIKIIPLKGDIPLQVYYHAVTDSSILVNNKNQILQYDHTGNFVRQIISRGRGPKEFINVRQLFVTDHTNKLYFSEGSNKAIKSVDLTTGAIQTVVPDEIASLKFVTPQETLYYKYMYGDERNNAAKILLCITDMKGSRFSPVMKNKVIRYSWNYGFLGYDGEVLFLDHGNSDTLYKVSGTQMEPKTLLHMEHVTEPDGAVNNLNPELRYKGGIILSLTKYWQKTLPGPGLVTKTGRINPRAPQLAGYYLLDNTNTPYTIRSFYIDPLGFTIECKEYIEAKNNGRKLNFSQLFPYVTGSWGYYIFEAGKFKELLKEVLLSENLPPLQREYLSGLNRELTEEANPVLIIGKIK